MVVLQTTAFPFRHGAKIRRGADLYLNHSFTRPYPFRQARLHYFGRQGRGLVPRSGTTEVVLPGRLILRRLFEVWQALDRSGPRLRYLNPV